MCKSPVKLSPPTNQHPAFYRLDTLLVTQRSVRALKGKYNNDYWLLSSTKMTLIILHCNILH